MRTLALILACLMALPAQVQAQNMTAEEFDAYTRGKTLYFGRGGSAYGAEIYHENRRVEWSFLDGDCKEGFWYERDGLICFEYEDRTDPQCWSFQRTPGGLIAQFDGDPAETELYEAQDSDKEMVCKGPDVGV